MKKTMAILVVMHLCVIGFVLGWNLGQRQLIKQCYERGTVEHGSVSAQCQPAIKKPVKATMV